jgi:hypothetical protein
MNDLPRAVALTVKRIGEGWEHWLTPGTGSRPKLLRQAGRHDEPYQQEVSSLALRCRHSDGRAAVGVWVAPAGIDGATGAWAFDMAWRWWMCVDPDCPVAPQRHPAAIPTACTAAEFKEWITA